MTKVGAFQIDNGAVLGPAEYMNDPKGYAARIADIEAGRDAVFNYGAANNPMSLTLTLVLVSLNTHYSAWLGIRRTAAELNAGAAR